MMKSINDRFKEIRVFLCYVSQDKPIVRESYKRLLVEGWSDSRTTLRR